MLHYSRGEMGGAAEPLKSGAAGDLTREHLNELRSLVVWPGMYLHQLVLLLHRHPGLQSVRGELDDVRQTLHERLLASPGPSLQPGRQQVDQPGLGFRLDVGVQLGRHRPDSTRRLDLD